MIPHDDLTRWNRAGLASIQYVGGNAATFLERLRYLLAEEFANWQAIQVAEINTETDSKTQQRMLEQYQAERRDWAWELLRTFSRATHVLTAHINAYANEGYLGTATQWDNLRKIVEMLDYHPASPASASTYLALITKPEASGTLDAGFQVKYSPTDGSKAIVFETLEEVELDERLNALYVEGYGRAQALMAGQQELVLEKTVDDLKIGQPVIVEDEASGQLHGDLIAAINSDESHTSIRLRDKIPGSYTGKKGYARIHVLPKESLTVSSPVSKASHSGYAHDYLPLLEADHGLGKDDQVCISAPAGEQYRIITNVEGAVLHFSDKLKLVDAEAVQVARAVEVAVSKGVKLDGDQIALLLVGDWERIKGSNISLSANADKSLAVIEADYTPVAEESKALMGYTVVLLSAMTTKSPAMASNELKGLIQKEPGVGDAPESIFVPPVDRGFGVDGYLADEQGGFPTSLHTGLIKKISAPSVISVVGQGKLKWAWLKHASVDDEAASGELLTKSWQGDGGLYFQQQARIQGAFKHRLHLKDWDVNTSTVVTTDYALSLNGDDLPEYFRTGRRIYVERQDGAGFVATLAKRDGSKITLDTEITADAGYTVANTIIRANVALAGHGERKPMKILGSGDGTQVNQSFVLKVSGVAFVSDPSMATGVRAAIDVLVGGQVWEQVSTLRNSRPTDHHYTVRMTEDGYLRIGFGDGFKGRRLPSGRDNVRVSYRVGSGSRGNLAAHKLEKPVKPHRLIDKVFQPMASNSGNDMEGIDSLRESAPSSLLSLERAVSLEDFSNLTRNHSSVWDARAFTRPTGGSRNRRLEVVVVPAGGGAMNISLRDELTNYLYEHSIPNVQITLQDYVPALLALDIKLRIDLLAFDPELVRKDVADALVAAFKLSQRRIGQAVYQSDIYKVVESVQGVSSSTCSFADEMFRPSGLRVPLGAGVVLSEANLASSELMSSLLTVSPSKTSLTTTNLESVVAPVPLSGSSHMLLMDSGGIGKEIVPSPALNTLRAVKGLDDSIRVVRPNQYQVLYLDEQHPALNIQYEDVER